MELCMSIMCMFVCVRAYVRNCDRGARVCERGVCVGTYLYKRDRIYA